METLRALIRGDLSPAGNKISLQRQSQVFGYDIQGYQSTWVDSGTSALALALLDVKAKAGNVAHPKVIVLGYCCPDLVSAAVYAGVQPLVVDISVDDASYDLNALEAALRDKNVIAVVAINFLGIKERLTEIKKLTANTAIKIIEDNAQWFPASKNEHRFLGDYLLFSFGRGKPLSLLGGGVLFAKEALVVADKITNQLTPTSITQTLKVNAYNLLLHPHLYCYLNRAPFLHLGETHYHQHQEISAIGELQKDIFAANLVRYEQRSDSCSVEFDKLFSRHNVQSLDSINSERRMRLLRYPLLCATSGQRDELLRKFNEQGLGASPLYQRSLVEIPLVSDLVERFGDLVNSRQFARRLLTLPTHEKVVSSHLLRIEKVLNS